ncbi:MAG TPA: glycosyltransferase, partial [Gaiellaceae bacterium]|nr:glycosyltransferase [Gaiellaceae bacterium]
MKPRVLFVSRERFRLPLDGAQKRKWDAVSEVVEPRVVAAAADGSPTRDDVFRLAGPATPRALDGALYYLQLSSRIARELRDFRPDAALVQGIHETVAFLLARQRARVPTKLILDVQGDWHEATRLYGSPFRRLLNPLNDALA